MGWVSEKRPVFIRFDVIMVPFGWALRAFCYFKMPFAFPEKHDIGSVLPCQHLAGINRGHVNYELQYFLMSFLFVQILFYSFDLLKF